MIRTLNATENSKGISQPKNTPKDIVLQFAKEGTLISIRFVAKTCNIS